MSLSDFVESSVAISSASSPTVQSLTTGLAACYHTKYPDRVRVYSTPTVLEQLVTDGFSVDSPAYKMASAYAAAPNAPALFCVGRRALPPQQKLNLACIDGQVGDAYSFTLVSPLGVSSQISYTNVISEGAPIVGSTLTGDVTLVTGSPDITFATAQTLPAGTILSFGAQAGVPYVLSAAITSSTAAILTTPYTGTASSVSTVLEAGTSLVANGSTAVTFSAAQSLAKGALLMFANQPGVYYALFAIVSASTSGTLTAPFQGASAAATPTTTLGVLAGSLGGFDVINGSAIVATTSTQVAAVKPGDSLQFGAQLGTNYTVLAVAAGAVTLTNPYTGANTASSYASLVCAVTAAATSLTYQIGLLANLGTVAIVNDTLSFPTIVQLARTDGQLTDVQSWRSGGFSGSTGFGTIELTDITPDPGIEADLTAMVAANGAAFYGIALDSNGQAEVEAAASFCETFSGSHSKIGWFNTSDYGNGIVLTTTDLFSELTALTLDRSFVQQNNQQLLNCSGMAICGQALAMNPGSYTLGYKSEPLVPADSDTTLTEGEALAINTMTAANPGPGGKKGNYYKTTSGENWLWPGCAPSGQFFDLTIGIDWLSLQIQAAVATVLSGQPKVPFDDFGLQQIGAAIMGVLQLAAGPLYKFLLPNGQDPLRPIVVNTPTAASLSDAQRASRDVSGFTWSAGLQGAIQTAVISGTLLP